MTVLLINDRPNVPTGEEDFSEEEPMPLLYTRARLYRHADGLIQATLCVME